jgi:hypothetical protein
MKSINILRQASSPTDTQLCKDCKYFLHKEGYIKCNNVVWHGGKWVEIECKRRKIK